MFDLQKARELFQAHNPNRLHTVGTEACDRIDELQAHVTRLTLAGLSNEDPIIGRMVKSSPEFGAQSLGAGSYRVVAVATELNKPVLLIEDEKGHIHSIAAAETVFVTPFNFGAG